MAGPRKASITSKLRLNPKLKHTLNEAADVVAKNLAERFIRLRHVALASDARAEFRFDHVEHLLKQPTDLSRLS